MQNNSSVRKLQPAEQNFLDIETKNLEDGTTIIKMGNNTYEFPVMTAPRFYRVASR
jgi:hypothetical protein